MADPDYCPTAYSLFHKLAARQATLDQHLETCVECAPVMAVIRASGKALSEYVAQSNHHGVESVSPDFSRTQIATRIRAITVQ